MTHSIRSVILASGLIVVGTIGLIYVFLSEAIPLALALPRLLSISASGWLYSDLG
jgi:hypothetical protein